MLLKQPVECPLCTNSGFGHVSAPECDPHIHVRDVMPLSSHGLRMLQSECRINSNRKRALTVFATLIDALLTPARTCWGVIVHRWSTNLSEAGSLRPLLQQPQDMRCWSNFYNQFSGAGGINPVHSLILSLPPSVWLSLPFLLPLYLKLDE